MTGREMHDIRISLCKTIKEMSRMLHFSEETYLAIEGQNQIHEKIEFHIRRKLDEHDESFSASLKLH